MTTSVVLAVIPAMAYVLAFGYEYGYYLAYGFPQELISIDLSRAIATGVIFLIGVLVVFMVSGVVFTLLPSAHPLTPAVAQAITLTLAYLVFVIDSGRLDVFGWVFGLLLLWYLSYRFVMPILTQHGVAGYVRKYSTLEQMRQTRPTLFHSLVRALGPVPGMILAYFFIAVLLSVRFGWDRATQQEYYFVVHEPPERVMLRIYGDSIVLARLDRPARQILREYTVLRRPLAAITLREERIGPLTVER